eukprot:gnl/TRDRNA2_/TRDRNA2_90701_c0_seq1.p1 gnl/TRDRNA2_/TRDRNA2_90701_c0~~gnl/TRDRNA2_/TRDRNA2_90701_c0_seq1.p1  ORF type:complete len:505 (+),score=89.07 gnl/TRDRNA2_/TRDRNA2_90701_c0_seq1:63-1517(+)
MAVASDGDYCRLAAEAPDEDDGCRARRRSGVSWSLLLLVLVALAAVQIVAWARPSAIAAGVVRWGSGQELLQISSEPSDEIKAWLGQKAGNIAEMYPVIGIVIAILLPIVVFAFMVPKMLDCFVKFIIESFDRAIIGVDVHAESVHVNLWQMKISIRMMTVDNPSGFSQDEPMIVIEGGEFRFYIISSMLDRFQRIHLKSLRLTKLTVSYETQGMSATNSNLSAVLDYIEGVKVLPSGRKIATKQMRTYVLQEVKIEEIVVNIRTFNMDFHAQPLEDIYFLDFAKDTGAEKVHDIGALLLNTMLKASKSAVADLAAKAAHRVEDAKHKVEEVQHRVEEAVHNVQDLFTVKVQEQKHKLEETVHQVQDTFKRISGLSPRDEGSAARSLSTPEQKAAELDVFRRALAQTGLLPSVLCPPSGLTARQFAELAEMTNIDPCRGDQHLQELFMVLSKGRRTLPLAEFAAWLETAWPQAPQAQQSQARPP